MIFRERGREGEKEGEKHQCKRETLTGCPSYTPQMGGLNPQPRHVPWPEIETFGLWDDAQPAESHWPGLDFFLIAQAEIWKSSCPSYFHS